MLSQPCHRDKTTLTALEQVSLDGRTLDFWTDMGDDKPVRLTMIMLCDVASNMVLDYELAVSENAVDTVRVITRCCERYGIFDRLYTDNGSAFTGHLVAGGTDYKFRNKKSTDKAVRPLGACYHLGIDIKFALPGNAQAKIAERVYATLSRSVDDRPEFKGAHAGHNPGTSPNASVTPIPFDAVKDIYEREIIRYNQEAGRNSQGANSRSYAKVFSDKLESRVVRKPTKRQLYLARLIYKPVAVDRNGQITIDKNIYGDPTTQAHLLPFHGKGQRILLGRNPDKLSDPALAFDADGRLICEDIQNVQRGVYDSMAGARDAVATAKAANGYQDEREFKAALAAMASSVETPPDLPEQKVVGARFNSPLTEAPKRKPSKALITKEYLANFDRQTGFSQSGNK